MSSFGLIIADAGSGLRAGQKEVLPDTPCHGDIFHVLQQYKKVVNILSRQAASATAKRLKLEQKIVMTKRKCQETQQHSYLSAKVRNYFFYSNPPAKPPYSNGAIVAEGMFPSNVVKHY